MREALALVAALLLVGGCPSEERRAAPGPGAEEIPLPPRLDAAFLQAAFGAGFSLATEPLLEDLDPRPGTEALAAIARAGRYEVVVVRGNRQVLARAPLAGKVLGQTDITHVGKLQAQDLLPTSALIQSPRAYLLPIETLVYQRSVCGILAFRYRRDALALVGEFSSKCWRKEAGGEGGDPMRFMKVIRDGDKVVVQMQEELDEAAVHRWDPALGAFVSPSAGKAGARQR